MNRIHVDQSEHTTNKKANLEAVSTLKKAITDYQQKLSKSHNNGKGKGNSRSNTINSQSVTSPKTNYNSKGMNFSSARDASGSKYVPPSATNLRQTYLIGPQAEIAALNPTNVPKNKRTLGNGNLGGKHHAKSHNHGQMHLAQGTYNNSTKFARTKGSGF